MADDLPLDRLVRIYMKMRSKMQELDAELERIKAQQTEVKSAIKDMIRANGDSTTGVKTAYGTVSITQKTRYTTNDWPSFQQFVIEHDAIDLFEKRIAQKNMAQFLADNKELVPPGLNTTTEFDVSIRRPT